MENVLHKVSRPQRESTRVWVVPIVVAGTAAAINVWQPLISPLLLALLIGAVVANSPVRRSLDLGGTGKAAKFLLRAGIVLLGLRLSLSQIASIGVLGVLTVLLAVLVTFYVTKLVGRRLGLEDDLVDLIATGFSICGAAAIAAVQETINAKRNNVAIALALVTLFGTVMIGVIPVLGAAIGLTAEQQSLWVGASIHEVAQVVAAAALVSGGSLAVAMSVKLGRVLMLVPVHHLVARQARSTESSHAGVPWFLWGFMATVAIRSTGWLPSDLLQVTTWIATVLLSAGMFGLGLGLGLRDLWPVPPRALLLSLVATSVIALVPLGVIAVI